MEDNSSMSQSQDNSAAARAKRQAAREAAACAARQAAQEAAKAARKAAAHQAALARQAARDRRAARDRAVEVGKRVIQEAIEKANLFLIEEVEQVEYNPPLGRKRASAESGEKSAWFNHVTYSEIIERFLQRYPQFKDNFPPLSRRGSSGLTALKQILFKVAKLRLGRRRQINSPTASGTRQSTRGFVGWRWRETS